MTRRLSSLLLLPMLLLAACGGNDKAMVPIGPGPGTHAVSLATDGRGGLYAGMGSGEVLAYHGGADWRPLGGTPVASGITALEAQPRLTLASAEGAWVWQQGNWRQLIEGLPETYRATALLRDGAGGLFLATGNAIYHSQDGLAAWRPLPTEGLPEELRIYRLGKAPNGDLLAATSGHGLLRLEEGGDWRDDSHGLPAASNVFSIEPWAEGLVIGTEHGPYARKVRRTTWQPLGAELEGRRVIALARTRVAGVSTLWAGGDDGVYRLENEVWQPLPGGSSPRTSVAWLLSGGTELHAAAGQVYRLERP